MSDTIERLVVKVSHAEAGCDCRLCKDLRSALREFARVAAEKFNKKYETTNGSIYQDGYRHGLQEAAHMILELAGEEQHD
jgi:hypothetical protein